MERKKQTYHDFIREDYSSLKRGIDFQRELYKSSMHEKDYDSAVAAIENIKIEIRKKVIARGSKDKIDKVSKICEWYRFLPFRFTVRGEHSNDIVYPADIELKIIKNLNAAYGYIADQLNVLGLL